MKKFILFLSGICTHAIISVNDNMTPGPVFQRKRIMKTTTDFQNLGILTDTQGYQYVDSLQAATHFFPLSCQEIETRSFYVQQKTKKELHHYLAQDPTVLSKHNALYKLDKIWGYFDSFVAQLALISMVHPDTKMVEAAQKELEVVQKLSVDLFGMNPALYVFLKKYNDTAAYGALTLEENYFLTNLIAHYERNGLNLSSEVQDKISSLKKELADLTMQFDSNIAQDNRTVIVTCQELQGVPDDFIKTLKRDEHNNYILSIDYPTYDVIVHECQISQTRKKVFESLNERAYPVNESILNSIIAKRHELATLLGFKDFAQYDLSNQMTHDSEKVEKLYTDFAPHVYHKVQQEKEKIYADLAQGVSLNADGTINAWDWLYSLNVYRKKHYQVDETVLQEYFPLQETMQGLFKIYETFFSIQLEHIAVTRKWHEDVSVVKVSKQGHVVGYIFLDLHPRPNKYTHAAVFEGKPTHKLLDGTIYPGVCTLVCNFTKATDDKPALLTYSEVNTFFHEFGHALHAVLGITHLLLQAGTQVKSDFVELPSQILELWLEDKSILKMISKHYKTGQSLSDELIHKKLESLHFSKGYYEARQAAFAHLSLRLFQNMNDKSIYQMCCESFKQWLSFVNYGHAIRMVCNFGHLCGYGAKYYGYLWSRIFATHIFQEIEKEGLLNPEAGKKYLETIIAPAGSKDPNDLLYDYLGCKPSQEAFLKRNKFI